MKGETLLIVGHVGVGKSCLSELLLIQAMRKGDPIIIAEEISEETKQSMTDRIREKIEVKAYKFPFMPKEKTKRIFRQHYRVKKNKRK